CKTVSHTVGRKGRIQADSITERGAAEMTSPYNALNAAIYTKLSGGTALTGALGGTCIYHGVAPEGAALPYVVWSYAAGGADNFTPRESVQEVVYVRAYADDAKEAAQLDAHINNL